MNEPGMQPTEKAPGSSLPGASQADPSGAVSIPGESTSLLAGKVGVATGCRLLLNTAKRFAYPFAPVLSFHLEVPLTAISSLIAVNQGTTLLGLFSGPIADRFGYRLMMLGGMATLALGMGIAGVFPSYGPILVCFLLAGIAKTAFDPAVQAYVSERVPYRRRGRAVGFLEYAWAGSTLIGIPASGLLIEKLGWRAPFFAMGGLGLMGWLALWVWMNEPPRKQVKRRNAVWFGRSWKELVTRKETLGVLIYVFFVSVANDSLFVVYGAWIEKGFHLSILGLGLGTSVIGAAEFIGESITAGLADRLGLKRCILAGLLLTAVGYGTLPWFGRTLTFALLGLFSIFLTFEFTVVTSLSLATELLVGSRATMIAGFYAIGGIGRVVGVMIGGPIWLAGGIEATGISSAIFNGVALAALAWGLRDFHKR